jgi:hypothetical protein
MAPPWLRATLFVKPARVIWSVPPVAEEPGLTPSTHIAPPKPPPLEALAVKMLSMMLTVLERTWTAPPAVLYAAFPVKVQLDEIVKRLAE